VPTTPFLNNFAKECPPLISRSEASRLTGGLISPRTLANLDSLGQGPKNKVRLGKKVAYERQAFLDFLAKRLEVDND